jgi:hypothetical protein
MNVYLIGDVLIDAATRWSGRRILRQLSEHRLSLLAMFKTSTQACVPGGDSSEQKF